MEALHRKIHLVTTGAGLAECHLIAQLGTALEALLFQLMDGVYGLTPFVQQMVGTAIDGLAVLFQQASRLEPDPPLTGKVVVLDPDTASAATSASERLRCHTSFSR